MRKVLVAATVAALLSIGAMAQTGTWRNGQQNSARNQSKETAQEKASGINDQVDITSGPNVSNVTRNSATLTWTTNKNAATRVRYGTNQANPGKHAFAPGGATQHSVQLTGLQPGQTYHYEIENKTGHDRFKGSFQTPR
jgi:Purple acid Phosphatase, N-terminal domain